VLLDELTDEWLVELALLRVDKLELDRLEEDTLELVRLDWETSDEALDPELVLEDELVLELLGINSSVMGYVNGMVSTTPSALVTMLPSSVPIRSLPFLDDKWVMLFTAPVPLTMFLTSANAFQETASSSENHTMESEPAAYIRPVPASCRSFPTFAIGPAR